MSGDVNHEILVEITKISVNQQHMANSIADLKIQDETKTAHISSIKDGIAKIDKRQAVLEVKAGLFGTIGGFLSALYMQIKHTIGF